MNDPDDKRFSSFKRFSEENRNQTKEQVQENNVALLFAKVNTIEDCVFNIRKEIGTNRKENNNLWIDVRGQLDDIRAKFNVIIAELHKQGRAAELAIEQPLKPRKKMGLADSILLVMQDGAAKAIYTIWQEVQAKALADNDAEGWPEASVGTTCSNLCNAGKIAKIRRGIYQMEIAKEGASSNG